MVDCYNASEEEIVNFYNGSEEEIVKMVYTWLANHNQSPEVKQWKESDPEIGVFFDHYDKDDDNELAYFEGKGMEKYRNLFENKNFIRYDIELLIVKALHDNGPLGEKQLRQMVGKFIELFAIPTDLTKGSFIQKYYKELGNLLNKGPIGDEEDEHPSVKIVSTDNGYAVFQLDENVSELLKDIPKRPWPSFTYE